MVLDTSVLIALLGNEEEAPALEEALEKDPIRLLSAGSLVETMIVVEGRWGEPGSRELDLLLHKVSIEVVSFDRDQAQVARGAFRRFGKGRHPASLNFGDCFSYALSKISGEPLLFVGQDFSQTDLTLVRT